MSPLSTEEINGVQKS